MATFLVVFGWILKHQFWVNRGRYSDDRVLRLFRGCQELGVSEHCLWQWEKEAVESAVFSARNPGRHGFLNPQLQRKTLLRMANPVPFDIPGPLMSLVHLLPFVADAAPRLRGWENCYQVNTES